MPSWLVLSWALTVGYMPSNAQSMSRESLFDGGCYEQTIGGSAEILGHIRLLTDIVTLDRYVKGEYCFSPFRTTYHIALETYAGPFTVGCRHFCTHAVDGNNDGALERYSASATGFYLTVKGTTR